MTVMTKTDVRALTKKAIEALPEKVSLIYVDYRDEFTDQQCALIVGGKDDEVMENLDFNDSEYDGVESYLEDALPDEEERQAVRDDEDAWDEFRETCYERDISTPYNDLMRNTGRKLVRFYVRKANGERIALGRDSWNWSPEQVDREAKRLCRACRLDWTKNAQNFRELVVNATYGGVLCLIAYVDMDDVADWTDHCFTDETRARIELTFINPHILVHDPWNGSGHDVQVDDIVTIKFGRGALDPTHGVMVLDAKNTGTGYSWDETCCLYRPAYQCDPKVNYSMMGKNAKPDVPAPESWPGT